MNCPPFDRSRRQARRVAGVAGITAAAGCLTSFSQADSCSDESDFSLDEATATGVSNEFSTPVDGLSHATQTVVSDALDADSGESTSRDYYSPHPHTEYVVTGTDTHYYHVETTDYDRVETTGYEYSAEIDIDESSLSASDRVRSFAELPSHDRESLLDAIGNPHLLHAPHYTSFTVVFAYERDETQNQSVFVPGGSKHYLKWEETLLRLTFDEQRTAGITSTTVSTELVAESPGEFVEYVGSEHGVVLDSLTSQHRDIITQAINGTYAECKPYSEAFSDLREQLSTQDRRSVLLVRYNGDWYFVHLS